MSHFLPWPWPRVLAHRGGGTLAPENTLGAIRFGYEQGFRAIEFDAMLAADSVAVLMHDPTLERTTSGRGPVPAWRASDLARLDAGAWHSARFAGEPVPQLADAIAWCRAHDVWLNVEIKPAPGFESVTGARVAEDCARAYADLLAPKAPGTTQEQALARLPLLSSFERDALVAARAAAPGLPRGYLLDAVPENWMQELAALGCIALHTNHRYLTRALARAIKDAGYWLFCYTVDEPARARQLFDWGVDALCTDRLDLIGADFAGRGTA